MKSAVLGVAVAVSLIPQQTFRSGVNVAEVYATVVDRGGRLVPDLTRDDFEIYDNGERRRIEVFARGTQPITIALMIDESPSVSQASGRIAEAVEEFSRHFLPGDRAALGAFSHLVRLDPELSASPGSLVPRLFGGRPRFPAGTALWDALDAARAVLRNESGRRVVLVLTDADDNCSLVDPAEVVARIEREGTMVYAIGVKGTSGLPVRALRDVSRHSGGYYFELQRDDDLAATFRRVADELHRQYAIGFVPVTLDGKTHSLEVKTTRPGLTVRTRRTYIASKAGGGV